MESWIKVGYGRADITPKIGTPIGGYGNDAHRLVEEIRDVPFVTCVAFTDTQDNTVLICSADMIHFDDGMTAMAREAIEAATGDNQPAPKPTAPITPEKRQEVAKNLTAPDGNATELQIKGLKAALAKLMETDPSKEDFVTQIALQTNGLTEISKADCEKLVEAITAMLEVK